MALYPSTTLGLEVDSTGAHRQPQFLFGLDDTTTAIRIIDTVIVCSLAKCRLHPIAVDL